MSPKQQPPLTLVTGGARSGKSRLALELLDSARRPVFLATLDCSDDEMRDRVAAHRRERSPHWRSVEAQRDLVLRLAELGPQVDGVLLDCLTNYVANCQIDGWAEQAVADDIAAVIATCARASYQAVIVSNEVGFDITPDSELGSGFPRLIGAINQQVAVAADRVYLMMSGVPVRLK